MNSLAKRGLGKGLQALIPEMEEHRQDSIEIKIRDIHPNQYQPRRDFDLDKLQELADSIKEHGVIQPIVVTPFNKGYQIVAGERRWRAASMIGLKEIPAVIKEYTQQQLMEIALIENLAGGLNAIEEASIQTIDQSSYPGGAGKRLERADSILPTPQAVDLSTTYKTSSEIIS